MAKALIIIKDGMLEKVFSDIPLIDVCVIELKSGDKVPFVDRKPCEVSNYSLAEIETAIRGAEMQIELYLQADIGKEAQDGTGSTNTAGDRPGGSEEPAGQEAATISEVVGES